MANFQILQGQPSFVQGAGIGLSSGLNQLAQQKLQEIQQANESARYERLLRNSGLGYTPGEAAFVAQGVPPSQRLSALQSLQGTPDQFTPNGQTVSPLGQIAQSNEPVTENQPQAFSMPDTEQLIAQSKQLGLLNNPEDETRMRQRIDAIRNDPQQMAQLQAQYENDVKQNNPIELRKPGYQGPAVPLDQALAQAGGQAPSFAPLAQTPTQPRRFGKPGATATARETTQQKEEIKQAVKQDTEYKEQIEAEDKEAKYMLDVSQKLKKYVDDPSFVTGFQYAIAKNITGLPKANQEFDKEVAESIVKRSQNAGSRSSDALRKLVGQTVPDPYQNDKEGIKALLSGIEDRAQTARVPAQLYRDAQKRYGKLPTGWSDSIKSVVSELQPVSRNSQDNELQFALNNPQEYEEGTAFDLGNGRIITLVNGLWQEQ